MTYAIGLEPNGRIFVMERSTDVDHTWIILGTMPTLLAAQEFIRGMDHANKVMGEQAARLSTYDGA